MKRLVAVTGSLFALLPVAVADAATVEVVALPVTSFGQGHVLEVKAQPGEANRLRVAFDAAANGWRVTDTVPLAPGPGCGADGAAVFCPRPGTDRYGTKVDLGDGDDEVELVGDLGRADPVVEGTRVQDGAGDDNVVIRAGTGSVHITPGAGADLYDSANDDTTVEFVGRPSGIAVTLNGADDDGESGEHDDFRGLLRTIIGSPHADEIHAGESGSRIYGAGGDDRLYGGAGNDFLSAQGQTLEVHGGDGDDHLDLGRLTGRGTISGGDGRDGILLEADGYHYATPVAVTLDGVANDGPPGGAANYLPDFEWVNIQAGRLVGSDASETLFAREYVDGRGGDDLIESATVVGGPGRDTVKASAAFHGRDGEADTVDCPNALSTLEVDTIDHVDGQCLAPTPPTAPAAPKFGQIARKSVVTRADRRGTFVVRLRCAAGSSLPCSGYLSVRPRRGIRSTYGSATFRNIKPGSSKRVRIRLSSRMRKSLARGRSIAGRFVIDTTAPGTRDVKRFDPAGLVRIKPSRRG